MAKPDPIAEINRREFLRLASALGGAAALAPLLEACAKAGNEAEAGPTLTTAPATPTQGQRPTEQATEEPQPAETEPADTQAEPGPDGKARVAFVKTGNRAAGVRQVLDLLGIAPVAGKSVFLKPNFNSADPTPGSTHLDTLEALVTALQGMGAMKITLGDRSGMGDTRQVMKRLGVFDLAKDLGFDVIVFDELDKAEDWTMMEPPGSHWEQGFPFVRPALEAEAVVQTCCLKTHRYGGHFTLSLKNAVGLAGKLVPQSSHNFMNELHSSSHQRRMIAEINTAYTPALILLDGVEGFISGGPDKGERVASQVMLAGTDRIAIDAVGVALLRYWGCKTEAAKGKIFEQEQIARAVELGLGVGSPEQIELLTGDPDSAAYGEQIKEILLAG